MDLAVQEYDLTNINTYMNKLLKRDMRARFIQVVHDWGVGIRTTPLSARNRIQN